MPAIVHSQRFNMVLYSILGIISLSYYYSAPIQYSLSFNTSLFTVFCVAVFFLLKSRCKYSVLNFEFLFTISYAFVNYAYPMVYYNIDPYFSLFALDYPENYINRGTALATVAYSFLCLGLSSYPVISKKEVCNDIYIGKSATFLSRYTIFLLLLMVFLLIPLFLRGSYDMEWGLGNEIRGIMESLLFYTFFQHFYCHRGQRISKVINQKKLYFFLVLAYVVLSTAIGNRGNIIRIGFLAIILYDYLYHPLNRKVVISLMILGMLGLYVRGAYRDSGSLQKAREYSMTYLDIGRDLTINNRSLYVLMEYADKHGCTYGRTFLGPLLSPIPYAQSTLLSITGWTAEDILSGSLITTDYFSKNKGDRFGLGTNVVGDVYLSFGLLGVILLFYLLGKTVSRIYYKSMSGIPISFYVYTILLINTIIWVRSEYFKPLQMVVWGLALYYIFDRKKMRLR